MRQEQSIQAAFVKLSNQTKLEHKIRLKASIEVARLLLNQGLAFRGHREDESSLNKVGGSFKRMDELENLKQKVQVALDMGEVESGKGLNQELGLARAILRWGSHYKSFKNFIKKAKATGYLKVCQTFEIAFILHLMRDILAITNELNESLQKKEQDIANAILLVKVVKKAIARFKE
ncbi:hypothetical protein H5410_016656 [Solanum commersonii]|uniref:DUF4371 domain-containing protein n=1 Tax=Solanum commersonii TaxID=4109 RepID=A0A9J5ZX65_SOLCO|nr:hypothetical protein H5410_016656 [Solanum commersonii]